MKPVGETRSGPQSDDLIMYQGRPYYACKGTMGKKLTFGMLFLNESKELVPILRDSDFGTRMIPGVTYYVPMRQFFPTAWKRMEAAQLGYPNRLVTLKMAEAVRKTKEAARIWAVSCGWKAVIVRCDGGGVSSQKGGLTTSHFEWTVTHGYRCGRVPAVNSRGHKSWIVMWRLPGWHSSEDMKELWWAKFKKFRGHKCKIKHGIRFGIAFAEVRWNEETRGQRKAREKLLR